MAAGEIGRSFGAYAVHQRCLEGPHRAPDSRHQATEGVARRTQRTNDRNHLNLFRAYCFLLRGTMSVQGQGIKLLFHRKRHHFFVECVEDCGNLQ